MQSFSGLLVHPEAKLIALFKGIVDPPMSTWIIFSAQETKPRMLMTGTVKTFSVAINHDPKLYS